MLVSVYPADNELFMEKEIACYYKRYKCNTHMLAAILITSSLIKNDE